MRELFTYGKLNNYPHMKPRDIAIWERFIEKYPDFCKSCQYDFNVGEAPPFNTLYDDNTDHNQDMLYRLKIDVIGHNDSNIEIIEIKPNAGTAVIGQIKAYKTLYERDESDGRKIGMTIITDIEKPNMAFLCKQEGVKLFIV